jgi:hypothetical protein
VVIQWVINEKIVSADDLKTCIANFCFNQIRAYFVPFGLHLASFSKARSWPSIDNDETPPRLQRFGQLREANEYKFRSGILDLAAYCGFGDSKGSRSRDEN